MKILLVRALPHPKSINLQSFMISEPLEFEYLSQVLKTNGHEVDFVDLLIEKAPLTAFLKQKNYDFACFTAYINLVGQIKQLAKIVKQYNPHIYTVVGGVHAEVVPEDFLSPEIDYILFANGIDTLNQLLKLEDHATRLLLPGVYQPGKARPKNLPLNLPLPDRKLTAKYRKHYHYIYHEHCATLKTSFGCAYHCSFCFCTQISPFHERPLDEVIEEIKAIEEDNIFIVDDNFLYNRERIEAFCQALHQEGIKKQFIAFGRADFIAENEDIIALLAKTGFQAIFVGIESFKNQELNDLRKRTTVEINTRAIRILERNGLDCYSGIIVGEDWERHDFDALIAYLNQFEHPLVNIQPLTPMPGTPYFKHYQGEITVPRERYELWDMAHIVFKPKKISKRNFYYHILRAYLKTSVTRKQRQYLKRKYGKKIYKRVKKGAKTIYWQYVALIIKPEV